MEQMSISDLISIITAIAAFITAVVALFTLIELSRQRKASYKPEICILQNSFVLRSDHDAAVDLALCWQSEEGRTIDSKNKPYIQIANIGSGPAKSVQAKWEYDIENIIKTVNSVAQKLQRPFLVTKDDLFINIKQKEKYVYRTNAKLNSWEFEYLLPVNIEKTGRELFLPPAYAMLISTLLSFAIEDKESMENLKIPELKLQLTYTDIGKECHRSTHRLACQMTWVEIVKKIDDKNEPSIGVKLSEIS